MNSFIIYLLFSISVEQWFKDHYQFACAREMQIAQYREQSDSKQLKKEVLSRILDRYLLYLEGKKGKFFSKDRYWKKIEQLKEQYQTDDLAGVAILAKKGVDQILNDLYVDTVIEVFLEEKLFQGITISREELLEHYRGNYQQYYQKESIELYQIVVASPMLWEKVLGELKIGNFCELAKKYSSFPGEDGCGGFGMVQQSDLPDLYQPAFKLKKGKISKMITSDSGYHLFWVKSKRKGYYIPFEEARKRIYGELLQQKQEQRLKQFIQQKRRGIDLGKLQKQIEGV